MRLKCAVCFFYVHENGDVYKGNKVVWCKKKKESKNRSTMSVLEDVAEVALVASTPVWRRASQYSVECTAEVCEQYGPEGSGECLGGGLPSGTHYWHKL